MPFNYLKGVAHFPRLPFAPAGAPSSGGTLATLDANGEKVALMCQATKAGNIRKLRTRITGITGGGGTSGTLRASMMEVDRTGTPAVPHVSNLWATNTFGDVTIVDGTDDGTVLTATLTADATVAMGDFLAVQWAMQNIGTITGVTFEGYQDERGLDYPYSVVNTTGSYALATSRHLMQCAFEYSDGSIEPIIGAVTALTFNANAFSSSSTPDTYAARFQFPFPVSVAGFWLWADIDAQLIIRIVEAAYHQANQTGIVVSKTINTQDRAANGSGISEFIFNDLAELSADTWYRMVVEPQTTTNSTIYDQEFLSAEMQKGEDGGELFHLSTAKDPTGDGSWTNYNSGTFRSLLCGLLLRGFDDGTGGGGGSGIPGNLLGGIIQ